MITNDCKCGHNHITILPNVDKEGFELGGYKNTRLNECCECNCEKFEMQKTKWIELTESEKTKVTNCLLENAYSETELAEWFESNPEEFYNDGVLK